MLSRLAESFLWLARYLERAETVARVLDVTVNRAMDLGDAPAWTTRLWRNALAVGTLTDPPALVVGDPAAETTIARCVYDLGNPSSIVSTLGNARANAIAVRTELSLEVWENVNELYLEATKQGSQTLSDQRLAAFLRAIRDRACAIAGAIDGTLLHVDGWTFLQLGRYVERVYLATRILGTIESLDDPWPEWQRLLEMCCASHPFAHVSNRLPTPRDPLTFIVFNPTFPRSIRFALDRIEDALRAGGASVGDAEREAGRLRAAIAYADVDDVLREGLRPFAARIERDLLALVAAIERAYFPRIPLAPAIVA
jgi:uncharacterized alpha-E superfamily protein